MPVHFPSTIESFIKYLDGGKAQEYDGDGANVFYIFVKVISGRLKHLLILDEGSWIYWRQVDPVNSSDIQHLFRSIWNIFERQLSTMNVRPSVINAFQCWSTEFENSHLLDENRQSFMEFQTDIIEIIDCIECLRNSLRTSQGDLSKFTSDFDNIVNMIAKHFRTHLDTVNEREKRRLSSGVHGQMNAQEGRRTLIDPSAWKEAWKEPFRGTALDSLETKLARNLQALNKRERYKVGMSRIIPIVQSSGTGKSRLAEEYKPSRILTD